MVIRNILIIARWGGETSSDWYPWIKAELSKSNASINQVVVADMPNPQAPEINAWVQAIHDVFNKLQLKPSETLLVGHSVGCQAILHFLASDQIAGGFPGLVMVAGWWTVDHPWPTLRSWLDRVSDFATAKGKVASVLVLLGENDPFTADVKSNAELWRVRLDASTRIIKKAQHFNGQREPEILAAVMDILQSQSEV